MGQTDGSGRETWDRCPTEIGKDVKRRICRRAHGRWGGRFTREGTRWIKDGVVENLRGSLGILKRLCGFLLKSV